jgi:hypothetical protein
MLRSGLFIASLLAVCFLHQSGAQAHRYHCTIEEYLDAFAPDPHQVQPYNNPWPEFRLKEFDFDDETGVMTHEISRAKEGGADQWKVIQPARNGNDAVAVWRGQCGVSCPFETLRIRPSEKPTRFTLNGVGGGLMAGNCRP